MYEEAYGLVQDASYAHNQLAKLRLDNLDAIEGWHYRRDGTMGNSEESLNYKSLNFESNILAFEDYFIDKVTKSNSIIFNECST